MIKKTLSLIVLSLSIVSALAQNSIPEIALPVVVSPSPDAASLARYVDIPVNHSTGVPNINIPIYELKEGKLSLPISISYHAGGIKVRDIASVVGLGWALNAGGMVSRTVLGRRDELNEYQSAYKTASDIDNAKSAAYTRSEITEVCQQLLNLSKNNYETESDRYTYNFANHTGTFRYDRVSGGLHLMPYAPIRIEKEYKNNDPSVPQDLYFSITDEKGDQYVFGKQELSMQGGDSPSSGWSLTKIISADGKDEINFYYSNGESIVQVAQSLSVSYGPEYEVMSTAVCASDAKVVDYPLASYTQLSPGTTHTPNRLDSIVTENASVRFHYMADREDGRTMRLTQVQVYSKLSNTPVKQVSLEQSYFGTAEAHTLRLRLDKVRVSGKTVAPVESYELAYKPGDLPGYYYTPGYDSPSNDLIAEDYWGYEGGGGLPKEFLSFLSSTERNTYGGNRNPVYLGNKYILESIRHPTGGKTVFEFEANRTADPYFYGYDEPNANGGVVGGLRVKSIKNYSGDGSLATQKTYSYDAILSSNPIQAAFFVYSHQYSYYTSHSRPDPTLGCIYWPVTFGVTTKQICTASSTAPLTFMSGSPVTYSKVTEYNGGPDTNAGKTVYYYDYPIPGNVFSWSVQSAPQFLSSFHNDWGNASSVLRKKEVYNSTDDVTPIYSEENKYRYYGVSEFIMGLKVDQFVTFVDFSGSDVTSEMEPIDIFQAEFMNSFNYEDTKGFEYVYLLDSTIVKDFSEPENPITHYTTYQYGNLEHLQPTLKSVSDSKGGNLLTAYKYPHDFASEAPYDDMVNTEHVWSPVVEQTTYRNSVDSSPLESVKTVYSRWNGDSEQIYPAETQTRAHSSTQYEPRILFQGYDSHGNMKGASMANGPTISYLWGYNYSYPIAEVKNAQNTLVFHDSPATITETVIYAPGQTEQQYLTFTTAAEGTIQLNTYFGGSPGAETASADFDYILNGPANRSGSLTLCASPPCTGYPSSVSLTAMPAGKYTLTIVYKSNTATSNVYIGCSYPGTQAGTSGSREFYYEGFEDDKLASSDKAHTGERCNYGRSFGVDFAIPDSRKYKISWRQWNGSQWALHEEPFTGTKTFGQSVYVDDIRIVPEDALMTTYTYDPLVGMTSSTDFNNRTTYYEFDDFGRLEAVKDEEGNVLKTYEYHYVGQ